MDSGRKYLSPTFENSLIQSGKYTRVVGIDEVGRGCWAGPVYVVGYIFDNNSPSLQGVNDSKKLTFLAREKRFGDLAQHEYLLKVGEVNQIDNVGIGKTVELLMSEIIDELNDGASYFLVDGQFSCNFGTHTQKVIRGDSTYYSIAAASIIAKVLRDKLMRDMDKYYPGYGFSKHKGYGTRLHQESIKLKGITDIHRKSYRPIALYT